VPDPIPAPSQGEVEGAYRTLDGRWRVEAVRRGNDQFFRLVHAGNVLDGLDIAAVEQLLAQAGVSIADLAATDPAAPPAAQPGVA
jgi:bifunctional non-homologous end joining protein LigD